MKEISTSAKMYLVRRMGFSNKEAIDVISNRRLLINGKPAQITQPILSSDLIELDKKVIQKSQPAIYLAYNKPKGIESTLSRRIENNLVDALNYPERVYPAGRLDKESEGLLLLTNDGYVYEKIIQSNELQEKEYCVSVNKIITDEAIFMLSSGIKIMGKMTRRAKVVKTSNQSFNITLTQGLNRQIRRMCRKIGYEVEKLQRIRIINIHLEDLPLGKWRSLTGEEIAKLKEAIEK